MISYTPISLPYFAPSDTLPEPLPTLEEALSCTEFLAIPNCYHHKRCTVVRVNNHFVAKFGEDVRSIEAETILFVKEHTTVPVAKVYAIYKFGEDDRMTMIISEFIEGLNLADCIVSMPPEDIHLIKEKLREQTDDLRRIPAPGYYGAIGQRPLFDSYLAKEFGPFEEFEDFNRAWHDIFFPSVPGKRFADVKKFFTVSFECIATAKGHTNPVFTHGDLHEGNIIVRGDGTSVIIDFEASGFYHAYHERLQHQNNSCYQLDFLSEEFLDECDMQVDAQSAWNRAEIAESAERLSLMNYD